MSSFPYYQQLDQMDCGPTCLRMIARYYGRHYTAQTLRDRAMIGRDGVSLLGIADAAEAVGFKTIGVRVSMEKLAREAPLPCVLHWGHNHFVVLYKINGSVRPTFHIADPGRGLVSFQEDDFAQRWLGTLREDRQEGIALLLETTPRFFEEEGEKETGMHFRQLFAYLLNYKKLLVQLFLGMLVGSGLSLLLPFLTQAVVDIGIGTQNLSFIYLMLIAQLVLVLSSAAVQFLRNWILLHISIRLNLTILSEFLAKLMRLPVSFFDVKQFGDIIQRIGDHQRIQSFLTGQALQLLFSFINLGIFGFVLAYYSMPVFGVALSFSVVYSLWVVLFLKRRREMDRKRFSISSRNQSQLVQLIQGMQEIKLSGAETLKRWQWEQSQARIFKWNIRSLSLAQTQQAGALLLNQGKNVFITFLTAKAVLDGQLSLGAMMSIQYILGQFNSPVEQLVGFLQSWQDARMSLERLNEVHQMEDEEPLHLRTEWDANLDLVIRNLSYTYPGAGNEPVLRDINLRIPHGKTTAIVGTSGSGKTTLLKLLLRFYEPGRGEIRLMRAGEEDIDPGIGLRLLSQRAWRKRCGAVMQDGFIFSDTVARNIAVHDEVIDEERLYAAARIANIHTFIESMPLGYHTVIGAEGNGVSQGQRQRILIARAAYRNPQLLLFDEATNALDASNESVILRNLASFFRGRTVVVVAHRLSTVKHADQIIVMEQGSIVETGTHRQLVELKGKYFELVSNQLELAEA